MFRHSQSQTCGAFQLRLFSPSEDTHGCIGGAVGSRGARRAYVRKGALILSIAAVMIGGLVAIALWPSPAAKFVGLGANHLASDFTTDRESQIEQIRRLKNDAQALALAGNFAEARERYGRIHEMLDGRDLFDPVIRDLASQAAEGERTLRIIIAAQMSSWDDSTTKAGSTAPARLVAMADLEPASPRPPANSAEIDSQPSDFGPEPAAPARNAGTTGAGRANPVIPAAAAAELRQYPDAEIGRAIGRGADYLIAQFKDGEISPDILLSDSQQQGLDALCVYALSQAGMSINDTRLGPHGSMLPVLLDKLRAYPLVSDGKSSNRPLTYAHSLRAAALATYDRPEDRQTLKTDVAWLIANQIHGAYTYDDLYQGMMAQGMKPAPEQGSGARLARPPVAPTTQGGGDFGGGSAPPGVETPPPQYPEAPFNYTSPPYFVNPPPERRKQGPVVVIHDHCIPNRNILRNPNWAPPTLGGSLQYNPKSPPPGVALGIQPKYRNPTNTGTKQPPSGPGIPPILNDSPPGVITPPQQFIFPWDNSNSQYGLLGVWAGAEVGIEVPDSYWNEVEGHWTRWQLRDGTWGYRAFDNKGTLGMTAAGVASLLVTHDYLDVPQLRGAIGREPYSPNLAAGLAWLEVGDHSVDVLGPDTHYVGYDLFGIERIGLASGFKYFGSHDWYREMGQQLAAWQFPNGSWGHEDHGVDTVVETAYMLLFLSRGRHPVMMTKLKFGKYWDNRPRDLANLAKFAGRELERPLNWQVVGIEHDWPDYFDSPVLYIASHEAPKLQEADFAKLRNFVLAGGLIFTQADGGSEAFNKWVPELAKHIAPNFRLEPLPDNSPIYNIQYKVPTHPPMLGVSNGARLLLVHSPRDLSLAWQERSTETRRWAFEIGTNVFIYASGKPDLRNRLDSPYIPPPPKRDTPTKTMPLIVLKYDGNWNPEPAAWFRMSRYVQWEGGPVLDIASVPITELHPDACPIATLTGTDAHAFMAAETSALGAYVRAGGTLLIDSTGGENAFTHSVRETLLKAAFADAAEEPIGPAHPLLRDLGSGAGSTLRLRSFAIERLGRVAPSIQLLHVGKGCVVFSALDLTSGLLGTHTWGVLGYESASAEKFVSNLIAWNQKS